MRSFRNQSRAAFLMLALAAGSTSMAKAETLGYQEEETDTMFADDMQKEIDFFAKTYGIPSEELLGYDLRHFMDDYQIPEIEYSTEEIRELLEEQKDSYIDDGTTALFSIFDAESDATPERRQEIARIGYYYNPGTLFQRTVFDLNTKTMYCNSASSVTLEEEQARELAALPEQWDIYSWDENYEGEEEKTTGSLRWKLVFEYQDGTHKVFGGYTRDYSHLPDNFTDVNHAIQKVIKLSTK